MTTLDYEVPSEWRGDPRETQAYDAGRAIVRMVFVWTTDFLVHFGHPEAVRSIWHPLPPPEAK